MQNLVFVLCNIHARQHRIINAKTSYYQCQNIVLSMPKHRIINAKTSYYQCQNIVLSMPKHRIINAKTILLSMPKPSYYQCQNIVLSMPKHRIINAKTSYYQCQNNQINTRRVTIGTLLLCQTLGRLREDCFIHMIMSA